MGAIFLEGRGGVTRPPGHFHFFMLLPCLDNSVMARISMSGDVPALPTVDLRISERQVDLHSKTFELKVKGELHVGEN